MKLQKCSVRLAEVEAVAATAVDWILTRKPAELVAVWIEHSWMKGLLY